MIVKNSIDEKLLELQWKKDEEISGVMKAEWSGSKLSLTELMGFFGQVDTNSNGRPFVVTDDQISNPSKHVMTTEDNEVILMQQDTSASLSQTTPCE